MCKKPVISFTDKNIKIIVNEKEIEAPFIPENNDPRVIAELIDKIVLSQQFREEVFERESEFVKKISDPKMAGQWWDSFFEKMNNENMSINRNSSKFKIKLRIMYFLISNRLYLRKIKNFIK